MDRNEILEQGRKLRDTAGDDGWVWNDEAAELAEAADQLDNVPLCGPFIYTNEVHIIGGDDKAGKTAFVVSLVRSIIKGEDFVPGYPTEVPGPNVGILDVELRAKNNIKRNGKLLEEFEGKRRVFMGRPNYRKLNIGNDRVQFILNEMRQRIVMFNLHLFVFDNIVAWLGDDASKNDVTTRLFEGIRAIIEERNEEGHHVSFILIAHLTKMAKDRRFGNGEEKSRPSDIRGSGGLQSTAGAVMEVRTSQRDKNQSIVHLFNSRHIPPDNLADEGKGFAFHVIREPGKWRHEFLDIVDLDAHFGANAKKSTAPVEVQQAAKIDPSLGALILSLNEKMSANKIEKHLEEAYRGTPVKTPKRKAITAYVKACGAEPFGKKIGT